MPASSTGDLRIHDLDTDALDAVVAIHRTSFGSDPISILGPEATRRYYEWLLDGPHDSEAFGAFLNGSLLGVIVGGRFESLLSGYVRRNRGFLVWRMVTHPWLFLHPVFRGRGANALRRLGVRLRRGERPVPQPPETGQEGPWFEVLAVAVSPDARGLGVGRRMMAEAEFRAARSRYSRMELSVHPENASAIRFYEGLGWRKFPSGDAWGGRMRKDVTQLGGDVA